MELTGENSLMVLTKNQFVFDGQVFDGKLNKVRQFSSLVHFFDDGSYIAATGLKEFTKFSALGEVEWKRELNFHHSWQLSYDKKRILVLSADAKSAGTCVARYETFVILDVQTGKTIAKLSSEKFLYNDKKVYPNFQLIPSDFDKINLPTTNCAGTHFNSFYEIPPNAAEAINPAFARGNFVINDLRNPSLIILDKNLKKIVWSTCPIPTLLKSSGFHDAQLLPSGKFLFYQGRGGGSPGQEHMSIWEYDPISQTKKTIYPPETEGFHKDGEDGISWAESAGNVQETDFGYLVGHNDVERGGMVIFINRDGKILKTYVNPSMDTVTRKPIAYSSVKAYDLTKFLKNNRM